MDILIHLHDLMLQMTPPQLFILILAILAYGFYSPAGKANYRKQMWRDKHMKKWKKERGYK